MPEVFLTAKAESELESAHDWWTTNRSKEQADRWYLGFVEAISALATEETRWPLAAENDSFSIEIRQLNFGLGSHPTHRAVYTVRDDRVVVIRIRHLAQGPLLTEDD